MDRTRFDHLSRTLATRRQALRGLGAGILVGAGPGGAAKAATQEPAASTCTFPIVVTLSAGPNTGTRFTADLTIDLAGDGAIEAGSLVVTGSEVTFAATGQAHGQAITLQVGWTDGQFLTLTGAADRQLAGSSDAGVTTCPGNLRGLVAGPADGDTGTWRIDDGPATSFGTGGPDATGSTPSGTPTESVACEAMDCSYGGMTGALTWDPVACDCVCYDPTQVKCGSPEAGFVTCGFSGCACDTAAQSCLCPGGTEPCGNACLPTCDAGMTHDPGSCACVPAG